MDVLTLPRIPYEEWKYDMLFEYAKLIGVRGYYRKRKHELVEELYALNRDKINK